MWLASTFLWQQLCETGIFMVPAHSPFMRRQQACSDAVI
jgi:hypothetical protein